MIPVDNCLIKYSSLIKMGYTLLHLCLQGMKLFSKIGKVSPYSLFNKTSVIYKNLL